MVIYWGLNNIEKKHEGNCARWDRGDNTKETTCLDETKTFDFKNLSLYKLNFCLIRTKCAPQSKSSVRPAAAIYSRDKCDKISYSRDANVLYSRDIVFYIQGTSIYGFMWEWWEVARYSGFTDESWCNVQVGQKMFARWDNFIDRWETLWTGPGVWLFQEQQTDNIGDEHFSNIRNSDRYMHLMNICTNRLNDITHTSSSQTDLHVIHHQLVTELAPVLGIRHFLVHQAANQW